MSVLGKNTAIAFDILRVGINPINKRRVVLVACPEHVNYF